MPIPELASSSAQLDQFASRTVSPPAANGSDVFSHASEKHEHLDATKLSGLKLLMSYEIQDALSWVIEDLFNAHNVAMCIAQPIEDPLAFILDARTGLCIFTYAQCIDRKELKAVIKQLTNITFKFSVLWLLVIEEEEEEEEEAEEDEGEEDQRRRCKLPLELDTELITVSKSHNTATWGTKHASETHLHRLPLCGFRGHRLCPTRPKGSGCNARP